MQERYECQDEHQEHFEDHDEKIFDAKKTCKKPNLEIFNAWTLKTKNAHEK